jgi:hypothetical protein
VTKLVDSSFFRNTHTGNTFLAKSWQKFGDPLMANFLKKPETPEIKPPTVMPDPEGNDEAVKAARRRQIAEMQARSGRASTILSQSDQLGG